MFRVILALVLLVAAGLLLYLAYSEYTENSSSVTLAGVAYAACAAGSVLILLAALQLSQQPCTAAKERQEEEASACAMLSEKRYKADDSDEARQRWPKRWWRNL